MSSRCTGHCCKRFMMEDSDCSVLEDGEILRDMLIPLGLSDVDEDGDLLDLPVEFFTCRHLQQNGDCGIYQTRPQMCRDYPSVVDCEYTNCTLRR